MHFAHVGGFWTDLVDNGDVSIEGAKAGVQYTIDLNFGEFEFDWENKEVVSRIFGEKDANRPLLSNRWSFDLLSGKVPPMPTGRVKAEHFVLPDELRRRGATHDDYICVSLQGPQTPARTLSGFVLSSTVIFSILVVPVICFIAVSLRLVKKKKTSSL